MIALHILLGTSLRANCPEKQLYSTPSSAKACLTLKRLRRRVIDARWELPNPKTLCIMLVVRLR